MSSTDPKSSPATPDHEVVEVLETVIEIIEPGQGGHQYSVVGAEPDTHDSSQHVEIIEAVADPTADAHATHTPSIDHDHQVEFVEVFEDNAPSPDGGHDAVVVVHDGTADHHDDYNGD